MSIFVSKEKLGLLIDWLVFFFIIEEGRLQEHGGSEADPMPQCSLWGEGPILGGGRGLPVSLLKWGDRRRGAGTGLKEQCSSNFTWKK